MTLNPEQKFESNIKTEFTKAKEGLKEVTSTNKTKKIVTPSMIAATFVGPFFIFFG